MRTRIGPSLFMNGISAKASPCFLCNEVSEKIVWREKGLEGRLCRCGMLYTNRSDLSVPVDATLDHHAQEFYAAPAELKAKWMSRNCPPGRLLEVGCGEGAFLKAARAQGYEVHGIEPNPYRARRVKERLGLDVEQAFLENSRLPRSSFDVVYHCDLLAHFPEPISDLNKMITFLRPGGVLCFEVGILGGMSSMWYRLIGEIGLGQHLWFFSNQALKNMFEKSDLVVEKTQYFGLAPEVVLGKVCGVFNKRVLKPLLSLVHPLGLLPPPDVAEQLHQRTLNFLRYRVGHFAPRNGPQTLFVVARPDKYATPS